MKLKYFSPDIEIIKFDFNESLLVESTTLPPEVVDKDEGDEDL